MKKIIAFSLSILLSFILILLASFAIAETDISGLSFDELVDLVNKAQLEMMKSDKWQEVIVPEGIYTIGTDIPSGHWTISAPEKQYSVFIYAGKKMYDEFTVDFDTMVSLKGKENSMYKEGDTTSISLNLKDGYYLQIKSGSAIFTPYAGNSFIFH